MREVDGTAPPWIDVWDVATFDNELRDYLDRHAELIAAYWKESRRLFLEREAQTLRGPPQENVHGRAYMGLGQTVTELMRRRAIRTWHFTRLTDPEVATIKTSGLQPMSTAMIAARLDAQVQAGVLNQDIANALYAASPYHRQTAGNREGRIWLTAQPYRTDDSGVKLLLASWGGESVNFNHLDGPMHALLSAIGRPAVLEISLPLASTTRISSAANNVVDAYASSLGAVGVWGGGADIVAVEPILPHWILGIHQPGMPGFDRLGRGYPERFRSRYD